MVLGSKGILYYTWKHLGGSYPWHLKCPVVDASREIWPIRSIDVSLWCDETPLQQPTPQTTYTPRIFQHTPGTYPRPRTNSLWRNSFHLGVWGGLGYAPGYVGVLLDIQAMSLRASQEWHCSNQPPLEAAKSHHLPLPYWDPRKCVFHGKLALWFDSGWSICWWKRNPKQSPGMYETLQIMGIFIILNWFLKHIKHLEPQGHPFING